MASKGAYKVCVLEIVLKNYSLCTEENFTVLAINWLKPVLASAVLTTMWLTPCHPEHFHFDFW